MIDGLNDQMAEWRATTWHCQLRRTLIYSTLVDNLPTPNLQTNIEINNYLSYLEKNLLALTVFVNEWIQSVFIFMQFKNISLENTNF